MSGTREFLDRGQPADRRLRPAPRRVRGGRGRGDGGRALHPARADRPHGRGRPRSPAAAPRRGGDHPGHDRARAGRDRPPARRPDPGVGGPGGDRAPDYRRGDRGRRDRASRGAPARSAASRGADAGRAGPPRSAARGGGSHPGGPPGQCASHPPGRDRRPARRQAGRPAPDSHSTRSVSCSAEAAPGVLVETIRALIGPENQTLRLAVLVYARTQGIDLDEEDLDALFRALDPAPSRPRGLPGPRPRAGDGGVRGRLAGGGAFSGGSCAATRGASSGADGRTGGAAAGGASRRADTQPAGAPGLHAGRVPAMRRRRRGRRAPGPPPHGTRDKETHMADHGVRRGGSPAVPVRHASPSSAGCGKDGPRPGEVLDEASRAGRTAASFPAAAEDYFHDMDGGGGLTREEIQGRNTWIVWTGGNDRFWDGITVSSFGLFDLLKIVSSHPDKSMQHLDRSTRWGYLGLVNEPCFDKPTGPDPAALRPVARQAARRLSARSLRERAAVSGCPDRGARRERAGRLLLRVRVGDRRPPAVPESRLRRGGRQEVGPGALLHRREVLQLEGPGAAVPRRACRARSATSGPSPTKPPADPENPKWENLASNVGAQYFWVDRIFSWKNDRVELHVPAAPHVPARRPRHLPRVDRLHQQPAHHERGLSAGPAPPGRQALGEGDARGRGPQQPPVQRLRQGRAADRVLPEAGHRLDPACPEGRLGLGGRPGGPQSRLPQHRPLQRGVAAALQAPRRREADLADRDRGRPEELRLLARHRGPDAQHGALLPEDGRARTA